jgi:hypothetical protein
MGKELDLLSSFWHYLMPVTTTPTRMIVTDNYDCLLITKGSPLLGKLDGKAGKVIGRVCHQAESAMVALELWATIQTFKYGRIVQRITRRSSVI